MATPAWSMGKNERFVQLGCRVSLSVGQKKLTDYPLEQQASILADYWLLLVYGIDRWRYYQKTKPIVKYRGTDHLREIPSLYKKIVTGKG
ncbi:hypothetical protein GGER_05110 [Serratia rubidaea]